MVSLARVTDDHSGRFRVVVAVRDDLLGALAQGGHAQPVLSRSLFLSTPGEDSLKDILNGPITRLGYQYEDSQLLQQIVRGVEGELGALSLLNLVASRLWEARDPHQKILARSSYDRKGGIAGALAEHAESVIMGMPQPQVVTARRILIRLVSPENTRKSVAWSQALDGLGPEGEKVLEDLVRSRLITTCRELTSEANHQGRLQLIHESLIHSWERLAAWLKDSVDLQKKSPRRRTLPAVIALSVLLAAGAVLWWESSEQNERRQLARTRWAESPVGKCPRCVLPRRRS